MGEKPRDVETIYHVALKKASGEERSSYLDKVCGTDHVLRARVEALLEASQEVGNFLEPPVVGPDVTLDETPGIEGPGTKIGHYELLELIGEGGMGLVYLAEQKEPIKRRVALKIIKPGMDSKQVIARFEAERQALAVLDHPNIAHVFEAGTTEAGRPYFVMEHVKGMSITAYCDERKLNIEQRLRLFEQVCEGVHHAHQKGIIHRDLKPSNILVSVHGDRAIPKIIDFGIAKAITQPLTEKTFVTFQGQLLGTPEYMSPEQVDLATHDIDTRSDIYALGVVLYELLAGVLPFERESLAHLGFAEVQRTIREQEPASPSTRITSLGDEAKTIAASRGTEVITLARRLHRELEWIPMKAMRKDRCRRYRSASEMADDVRNYLNGLPLIAGPETTIYRVQKFVSKHAGSVATVALVATAIVLGLIVSTLMYLRSEKALEREAIARLQAEDARKKATVARVRAEQAEKVAQEQRRIAEEQVEANRQTLYFNRIAHAQAISEYMSVGKTREILMSCPEDLRGWEWHHLSHKLDQSLLTVQGHSAHISDIACSPCGRYFASASHEGNVIVWDAQTTTKIVTIRAHEGTVYKVSFSQDGKLLATAGSDKFVRIYGIPSGTEIHTLKGHENEVRWVSFAPSGKQFVSADYNGIIKVWNASTGSNEVTIQDPDNYVASVAFRPGSNQIVSGSGKVVRLWDVATQTEVKAFHGHHDFIRSVAVTPDGSRIISSGEDFLIKVWDVVSGTELMTLRGHKNVAHRISISPDGTRLVSAGTVDQMIKVWDLRTGQDLMTYRGHDDMVIGVAFSHDGERIVSGAGYGEIKIWDALECSPYLALSGHRGDVVRPFVFSPDGNSIVSCSTDSAIKFWDVTTGTEIGTMGEFENRSCCVGFHPHRAQIATGNYSGQILIWDTVMKKAVKTISGHEGEVRCLAFSHDGRRLVSGGSDSTVKIWNPVQGNCELIFTKHEKGLRSVSFSPNDKHIVSSGDDHTIRVWDANDGSEISVFAKHEGIVGSVAFTPDGNCLVSGSTDGTVRIWNLLTQTEVMVLDGHDIFVFSVAVSPDGRRIASLGGGDRTVKIWDATTGSQIMTIPLPGEFLSSLAFSPDGKTIAVTSDNRILLLESTAPTKEYKLRRQETRKARKLVDQLYAENQSYSKVADLLRIDITHPKNVRDSALQIAMSRQWDDLDREIEESFKTSRIAGKDARVYQRAVQQAQRANTSQPDDRFGLLALGMAQYRVGVCEEARRSLIRAHEIWMSLHKNPHPMDLSFLAMTQYQLGQVNEARATINILRNRFKQMSLGEITFDTFSGSPEIEAEKVLAGTNEQLLATWEHINSKELDQAAEMFTEFKPTSEKTDSEFNFSLGGIITYLSRIYYARGKCHLIDKDQDYIHRASDYETAVGIDPNYVAALKDLAWLRATCTVKEVRNPTKAVEVATSACELTDWKDHECLSVLACALSEVEKFTEAVKRQQEAIDSLSDEDKANWQSDYSERLRLYESNMPYSSDDRRSFTQGKLVSFWDFSNFEDNVVKNRIVDNLEGKLVNGAEIVSDAERGKVLDVHGKGRMECRQDAAFEISGAVSIGAWIKLQSSKEGWGIIISKGYEGWALSTHTERKIALMSINIVKNEEYLRGQAKDPLQHITASAPVDFEEEQWHHVVGTYDGERMCLYVDGNLGSSKRIRGSIATSDSMVFIGDNPEWPGEGWNWNGLIDDVRIYSYALSPEEVKMLYEGKEPPKEKQ